MLGLWIGLLCAFHVAHRVVRAELGCANVNMTDNARQNVLDYHNGFRSDVAMGRIIVYKTNNFTLPQGQNMYRVDYSCELERFAQLRASQCTWESSAELNEARVTLVGGYYPLPTGGQSPEVAFYNTFRRWLWEYNSNLDSTEPLTKDHGLEGATFLYKYNLEVGCAIKQNCWIPVDGVSTKMQTIVCAYRRKATQASTAYERGVGCKTNANCTTYPATCNPTSGICSLKITPPAYGQLSVNGTFLVGSNGQPVQIRGMSLFGTNKGNGLMYYDDVETIRQLKCAWNTNGFRAVLDVGNGTDGGYIHTQRDYPTKYHDKQRLDRVILGALQYGMYAVVDWHCMPEDLERYQPNATAYFSYITERFGMFPHIIYESFNEPIDVPYPTVKAYHLDVIKHIRALDIKNVILVSAHRLEDAADDPVPGANIAHIFHFYAASHWRKDPTQYALNKGLCLFCSEYGLTDHTGRAGFNESNTIEWWNFMDQHKISYLNWALQQSGKTPSAALIPGTTPAQVGLDSHLSRSGKIVKAKHLTQDNGVSC